MSGGFRGADPGSDAEGWPDSPEPDGQPARERPPRPVLVELAAAIVVVGGALSLLQSVDVVMRLGEQGAISDSLAVLDLLIAVGSIVLGVLIRVGRAWLVAINVLAVAGFLELTSGSAVGFLTGGLDVFVVIVLMLERPWFSWRPPADAGISP